ncbi:uncharacterized protein LOC108665536 isoform X2 [Hyalella azteca]|uniref:Uncharacterized protein LOC108665536 isoform X2 n=1 Tax=Hyalella azteca TaxID=294128 RepID=A0A8B7N3H7_HYAAZ|nr:uncharacterized protein LOC108665536 isoform X2 [Hyalella azteca]
MATRTVLYYCNSKLVRATSLFHNCTDVKFFGCLSSRCSSSKRQTTPFISEWATQPSVSSLMLTLNRAPGICWAALRHKSSKRTTTDDLDIDSDDNEEDGIVLEKGLDFADRRYRVPSLRIDACIKAAFKISRSQSEKEIYANKIRLNGEKLEKRSHMLRIDDVLEYVKQNPSKTNPSLIEISRAEVRHIGGFEEAGTHYNVVMRVYPRLIVPKWEP